MMTFGQKIAAYVTLLFLNVLSFLFFGLLAIIPLIFSIVAIFHLRRL